MFDYVFDMIPSSEKVENTYIISQFYVYKNRHAQYADVKKHYETLPPNIQHARYVQKYYLNACARLGFTSNSLEASDMPTSDSFVSIAPALPQNAAEEKHRVFIVYGNNPVNLSVIKSLLTASQIEYIDLQEQANKGQTIIEKFESEASKSGFALVLCTPENEGKDGIWYPRQNVIFECGYFMAAMCRRNVCLLCQENGKNLDLPSDISGILYISMDKGNWISELSKTLKSSDFNPCF